VLEQIEVGWEADQYQGRNTMDSEALEAMERRASDWMVWSKDMLREKSGGRCPNCCRERVTGLFLGRLTCAQCRWTETD
jgi:hypothetical protein